MKEKVSVQWKLSPRTSSSKWSWSAIFEALAFHRRVSLKVRHRPSCEWCSTVSFDGVGKSSLTTGSRTLSWFLGVLKRDSCYQRPPLCVVQSLLWHYGLYDHLCNVAVILLSDGRLYWVVSFQSKQLNHYLQQNFLSVSFQTNISRIRKTSMFLNMPWFLFL